MPPDRRNGDPLFTVTLPFQPASNEFSLPNEKLFGVGLVRTRFEGRGFNQLCAKKNKKLARFISGSWNISFRRFFIFISIFDFEKKNDLEFVQGNVTESVYLAGFWELISFY